MKISEKGKQTVLIFSIIAVIISGVVLLNKIGKGNNGNEEVSKDFGNITEITIDTEEGELYYKEESRGEEVFQDTKYIKFLKFKDIPTRLSKNFEKDKMFLMNMETGDLIYEFPNEEMYKADGMWIDEEDIFWTIKYYEDLKKVLIKSFDEAGNEINQAIEPENFEGVIFEDSGLNIKSFKCDEKYLYILSYYRDKENKKIYSTLQIYDKDGKIYNTYNYDTVCIYDFDIDGRGNVYVQTERSSHGFPSIKKRNMEDGHLGDIMPSEGEFIRYIEEKNQAYVLEPEEGVIQEYDINNRKRLGAVFTFGEDSTVLGKSPEGTVIDFFIGKNNDFYIAFAPYEEDEPFKFFAYREKGKKGNTDRAVTLTITAPYRQDFLDYAIKLYEIKYPEERIEYSYIYNNRDEYLNNNEQYGKQLTMKIISGEIGDIIMTGGSGLVYRDLFKTDAFQDLTPLLETDQKYKDLNKSVLNGIKINNEVRGLPISFLGYYYQVNHQLAEALDLSLNYDNLKWSEVLKLVKLIEEKEPDAHLFTTVEKREGMLITILIANMPDLIDDKKKEANLSQEWFIELIKEFKECLNSSNFVKVVDKLGDDCLQGSLFSSLSNNMGPGGDLYHFEKYNGKNRSSIIPIFTGEKNSNRVAYTNNMYSINGRSERKESAWKFLSFLLEENIQAYMWMPGSPTNIVGEDKYIKVNEKEMINQNKEISIRFYKERREAYKNIDYLYDMDYFKKDIADPIIEYLDDIITIEEAIKKAQENVDLRLNE